MSSQSKDNKALWVLAGAGALVGAAVVFHLLTNKQSASSAIFEDIDALGPPKKEMNGLLSFAYYKDLFILMQKHAKLKSADEKKELLIKRRQLLKDNKTEEYKEIVKDLIQREEQVFADIMSEVIDHLGMSE